MHQQGLPLPGGAPALARQAPSQRLAALLLEEQQLLKKIARKRKDLDRLQADIERTAPDLAGRLRPLLDRFRDLDLEVHALFGELLAPGRLTKRVRRVVVEVYEELQDGVISRAEAPGRPAPGEWAEAEDDPAVEAEAPASAERPDTDAAGGSVRALFLRLARALHPDTAASGEDRAERTEAMKELNRAYQQGDLARLLEIERALRDETLPGAAASDDAAKRCAALERTNQALREQLRALSRELRELRASPHGQLSLQLRRGPKRGGTGPLDAMVAEAEADLANLEKVRDHVRDFRDGRIDVDDFVAGPPPGPEDLAARELEEALTFLAESLAAEARPRRRQGRRRR